MDVVITVCDSAKDTCPVFPGALHQLHWPFDDPGSLSEFRRVRDQIQAGIKSWLAGFTAQRPT